MNVGLFFVLLVAIGVTVWDIRGHIDEVVFERFNELEKSIAELKRLVEH
jgi:hypothetical protein